MNANGTFLAKSLSDGRGQVVWKGIWEFDELFVVAWFHGAVPAWVARQGDRFHVFVDGILRLTFDLAADRYELRLNGPDVEVTLRFPTLPTFTMSFPFHPLL